MNDNKYARQILMFGEDGQRNIQAQSAAVVGLGGIGSQVSQGLAYAGVGEIVLIDDDRIEMTNLNRVAGAFPSDVGKLKVEVARDHILRINPLANVIVISRNLRTKTATDFLINRSAIFGCVDHDGPRMVLTELATAYKTTLIDVATEIFPATTGRPLDFGGRVIVARPGDYCLFCAEQIDRELAKQELETPDVLHLRRAHGYGLGSDVPAPAVFALNGVVANLAVTEFLLMVTGVRPPARRLTYKGMRGVVTYSTDERKPDCFTCNYLCGQGDKVNIPRYFLPDDSGKNLAE